MAWTKRHGRNGLDGQRHPGDGKLFFFIAGLVFLIGGAQLLVSGGVQIAQRLGISPLLIGLLIGFGTSTPELVTSVSGSRS